MKGISPFIATVILIAMTLTVATIIGAWYVSFARTESKKIGSYSEEQIDCSHAGIRMYDVSLGTSNITNGTIRNTGQITLSSLRLRFLCSNGNFVSYLNDTSGDPLQLDPGEEFFFNLTSPCTITQLIKITIETSCPSVYDSVTPSQIST